MRKRKWLVLTLLAVSVGAAVYLALSPCSGITEAILDRIQPGMTQSEVEALLKTPPGSCRFGGSSRALVNLELIESDTRTKFWESNEGVIRICFANGQVTSKHWYASQDSFWDRCRRLFRF